MYESFYKFRRSPFRLTPDPHFFFGSDSHKRGLAYLRYALQQGEGFVVITGAPGTGKTELMLNLLNDLPQSRVVCAQIVSTNLTANDLLELVAASFQIPFENMGKGVLLKKLEDLFKQHAKIGKRTLLLIDEAHNLSRQSLMELSMLCNFQLGDKPILQCFLLGQEKLHQKLDDPELAHLKQRVIASTTLEVFDEAETQEYILFRLSKAGWEGDPQFTDAAFRLTYQFTGGIPRQINLFCSRLLLQGYLEETHQINESIVISVIEELFEESAVAHAPFVLDEQLATSLKEHRKQHSGPAAEESHKPNWEAGENTQDSDTEPGLGDHIYLPRIRHERSSVSREDFPHNIIKEHAALQELIQHGANRLHNIMADGHKIDSNAQSVASLFINDREDEQLPQLHPTPANQQGSTNTLTVYPIHARQRFLDVLSSLSALRNNHLIQALAAGLIVFSLYFLINDDGDVAPANKPQTANVDSPSKESMPATIDDTRVAKQSIEDGTGIGSLSATATLPPYGLTTDDDPPPSQAGAASTTPPSTMSEIDADTAAAQENIPVQTTANDSEDTETPEVAAGGNRINIAQTELSRDASPHRESLADEQTTASANVDSEQAVTPPTVKSTNLLAAHEQQASGSKTTNLSGKKLTPKLNNAAKPTGARPTVAPAQKSTAMIAPVIASANLVNKTDSKVTSIKGDPEPQKPSIQSATDIADNTGTSTTNEITDVELKSLISSLTQSYRNGNLQKFIRVFSADAVSNDESNINEIKNDYRRLFSVTDKRNMIINGIQWSKHNGEMMGRGNFQLTVREKGAGNIVSYDGNINLNVKKDGNDVVITRLIYQYQ